MFDSLGDETNTLFLSGGLVLKCTVSYLPVEIVHSGFEGGEPYDLMFRMMSTADVALPLLLLEAITATLADFFNPTPFLREGPPGKPALLHYQPTPLLTMIPGWERVRVQQREKERLWLAIPDPNISYDNRAVVILDLEDRAFLFGEGDGCYKEPMTAEEMERLELMAPLLEELFIRLAGHLWDAVHRGEVAITAGGADRGGEVSPALPSPSGTGKVR